MRLRSFTAPTVPDAMRLVRDELGPDAVIIATETIAGGCLVTAALEDAEGGGFTAPCNQSADSLDAIAAALDAHGVPPILAQALGSAALDGLDDDPATALAGALAARFRFAPIQLAAGDRLLLIGPPGVGKTVTAAKLAAREVLMRRKLSVTSADTVRAGGVEQLAALLRVLDLPLAAVDGPEALAHVAAAAGAPLIIDTPGFNPYRAAERNEIRALAAAARAEPVLVLAAGMDLPETLDIVGCCAECGCRRFVATRLDVSRRLGSLLAAAAAGDYAFAEVGIAPDIADGLWPLTPLGLARLLLPAVGPEPVAPHPFDRGARP
jgi:flagellar biosynthesis protein FlhF